jgi:hypothetical protein
MGADNVAYDDEAGDCGGGSVTVVAQAPPDVMPIFVSLPSLLSDTQQPAPTAPPTAVTEAGVGVKPENNGTLRQFWHCVASGTDYFSLQTGLKAVSGGRLGNGWLAGALLGNSVQSVGDTIEAVADANFGKAVNVAAAEAFADTAGGLVARAAEKVPNVVITVTASVGGTVATRSFAASGALAGSVSFNLSTLATRAAAVVAKPLALLGAVKLPIDLAVAGFSAVACGVNF